MGESIGNLFEKMRDAAERAAPLYVQDLLTVEALSQLMAQEWASLHAESHENGQGHGKEREGEEAQAQPSANTLWRLAQRICSRMLHDCWCSSDAQLYQQAYINLHRHFHRFLRYMRYAKLLRKYENASEDAVHQTLEELARLRSGEKRLDDRAAFLGWSQMILHRNALAIIDKHKREETFSLEEEMKRGMAEPIDLRNQDPALLVVEGELREEIITVLASMRNKKHMQVLILQFMEDLDDAEIAQRMGVKVGMVYLWRHRAFRWLQEKHPRIAKLLRFLLR